MPQKTRLGKCAGEVSSGIKGGGDTTNSMEYIAWDKMLADTDYLEELVNNKLMILFLHPLGWLPCSCGGVRATGRFLPSGLKYDKLFRENAKQDVECKWSILGVL